MRLYNLSARHMVACIGAQVASPQGPPCGALRDMAVKMLTHLAGSPWAQPFQAAVAALPPDAKQRLQVLVTTTMPGPCPACKWFQADN